MVEEVPLAAIPQRPAKVPRGEARAEKQRAAAFSASLRAAARGSRWRLAGSTLLREDEGWFVQVATWPGWGRGAAVQWSAKPMALDPLFWDIVGLPEHHRLPLSFRALGRWALRPLPSHRGIAPDIEDPGVLAERVVAWCEERRAVGFASSARALLDDETAKARAGHVTATAVCLHILLGDLEGALRLCDVAGPGAVGDSGGFATLGADGTMVTFLDRARAWILARPAPRG